MLQEPKTQKELVEYAGDIMHLLIGKYHSDGDVFTDFDDKATGLIYRCAGSLSLLLLANSFERLAKEDEWASIVTKEFSLVVDHIKNKGFDASPLRAEALTTNVFSPQAPKQYHYLDSVSWVLSFALHVRLANRFGKLILEPAELQEVFAMIKTCLAIICETASPTGGWGFTSGSKPDLYYSYAVSECLADFGDYVLGESEKEIGIGSDAELERYLTENNRDLIATVQEKRKLTAKWLWETYSATQLGVSEIDPGQQLEANQRPHILLYFTYFVLDMLIVNLPEDVFEEDEYFKGKKQELYRKLEHALYLSRIDFDKAYDDREWWDNWERSSLRLTWDTFENPKLFDPKKASLTNTGIVEPGFVPLSLRCNALYAFYIAEGPDQKMSRLFTVLHENRHQDTGLWDTQTYNVMVTERAIEAVVDYNDYMTRFHVEERNPESGVQEPASLESTFRQLVKNEVQGCLADLKEFPSPRTNGEVPLTDETLVKKMISVLATANQHDRENAGDGLPFTKKEVERLQNNFRVFLSNLLYGSLERNVEPEQKAKLRANLDENIKSLFDHLAPWLAVSSKIRLGDLFSQLSDDTLKEIESSSAARPKGTPETKK